MRTFVQARLQHPQVVAVYSSGETAEGWRYLIMEYVEGGTLAELLQKGAVSLEEGCSLMEEIAAGVAAAHVLEICHRDAAGGRLLVAARDGAAELWDLRRMTRPARPTLQRADGHAPSARFCFQQVGGTDLAFPNIPTAPKPWSSPRPVAIHLAFPNIPTAPKQKKRGADAIPCAPALCAGAPPADD